MFDSGVPGFGISLTFVISFAIVAALLLFWLVGFLLRLQRRGAVSGVDSIIGGVGVAMGDFSGEGKVWLEGEAWAAHSAVPVQKDQEVVVTNMTGLTLEIKPRNN
jgi:membrane-bound serine protease (ClpP class)